MGSLLDWTRGAATEWRSTSVHSTLICGWRPADPAAASISVSAACRPISLCGSTTVVSGGRMNWATSRSS